MTIYQYGTLNTTALVVPDLSVQIVPPQTTLLNGVPTNIVGVVGTASYGPVNTPTICAGVQDYSKLFGPIQARTFDAGTPIATASVQGANNFRVVRVTDGTDLAATLVLLSNCLTLTARYTGSFGNTIITQIASGTAANSFKLIVTLPGAQPEVFDNIVGSGNALWVAMANAVNNGLSPLRGASQIVTATAGVGTTAPTLNSSANLTGGTDGASGVTATTLIGVDVAGARTGIYALRGQGCSLGVIADLTAYANWTTVAALGLSEGIYFIVSGPAGETIASATANKTSAGLDSYAVKLMLGDFCYWNDPVNGYTRLVSPCGFAAGRLANLSPEQSSLNKPVYGIAGTQKGGLPGSGQLQTYSSAELGALGSAAIDVISNPQPGGNFYGCRFGHNSSSSAVIHGDNYTRLTNYIAATLNAGMGQFVGALINSTLFGQVKATQTAFLNGMLGQKMLGSLDGSLPFSVRCDTTNNPQTRTALGYLQCDVQVQYQAINEFFLVNVEGGQTVTITRQTLPTGQVAN